MRGQSPQNFAPPPFKSGGEGRSYGLELIMKHEFTERFFGWLAYTLSRSEQTVYALNAPMQGGEVVVQDPTQLKPTWFPTDEDGDTRGLLRYGSVTLGMKENGEQ